MKNFKYYSKYNKIYTIKNTLKYKYINIFKINCIHFSMIVQKEFGVFYLQILFEPALFAKNKILQ